MGYYREVQDWYTLREEDDKMKKYSYRIIRPSSDSTGELN